MSPIKRRLYSSWALDLKKKNIYLGVSLDPSPNPPKNIFRAKGYWKIEKLNWKQFWISNSIGNVIFQMRFKK